MFLFLCPVCNYANSEYREINTSVGKVIIGLDREDALEKFGVPTSAAEDLWYYSATPEKFFVLFSSQPLLNIYLYPRHSHTSEGTPLEFKAFGYFSDMKIKDITQQAQLLISEPEDFILKKPGIIIPRKAGEYQVLAKYKGIFSNPAYLVIKESQEKEKAIEKLISINILPFKPIVPYKSQLAFVALGTFLDPSGIYFIKDISNQATWYIKQDKEVIENRDNTIFFTSLGKSVVFCRYRNLESFPQEVYVQDKPFILNETLKHITLLPEFISVASGKNINLRAFGTYHSNRVEDITHKVEWEVGDKDVLTLMRNGEFLTKAIGITEVTAGLNDLKSLATKIIVTDKTKSAFLTPIEPQEKKIHPETLVKDIRSEVEKLKQGLTKEEKKLNLIKIIPDSLEVAVGETGQVTALGIYSDNSQEDLTHLGDWLSSNDKIAAVSGGKIDTFSAGEAKIYVKFKGINSLPAKVLVEGPKLISIILSPQKLQMSMKDKLVLSAEGYFSDSSRKDITSLVTWKLTNPRIIKIEKGKIFPLKFGETAVYAEYSGIKSLPANIRIVFTMDWLIYMIIKGVFFLFLGIVAMFIVLYVFTEKKKNNLKNSLDKNPAEFIVNLYENTKKILAIFNLSYKESLPPLSYAEIVQKNYSIENNLFLRFTAKFEEARYSHHVLSPSDASLALNDYNDFLKIMFSRYNKFSLFLKYCLTLLHRSPLFISTP